MQGAQSRFLFLCFSQGNSYSLTRNTRRGFLFVREFRDAEARMRRRQRRETEHCWGDAAGKERSADVFT